ADRQKQNLTDQHISDDKCLNFKTDEIRQLKFANLISVSIDYLLKFDEFKYRIEQTYDMPDKMIAMLARFLEQGDWKLSKRAKGNDFEMLTDEEVEDVESLYREIFQS
ncbi:MAG: hypothetical protein JW861_08895, partial [Bacteroidales bacterium]|nr:hypothetical protein [Bacteroidales bacterium]